MDLIIQWNLILLQIVVKLCHLGIFLQTLTPPCIPTRHGLSAIQLGSFILRPQAIRFISRYIAHSGSIIANLDILLCICLTVEWNSDIYLVEQDYEAQCILLMLCSGWDCSGYVFDLKLLTASTLLLLTLIVVLTWKPRERYKCSYRRRPMWRKLWYQSVESQHNRACRAHDPMYSYSTYSLDRKQLSWDILIAQPG